MFKRRAKTDGKGHPKPLHSGDGSDAAWQGVLPFDIMLRIASQFLQDDEASIRNLSRACKSIYQLCLPLFYHSISLPIERKPPPSGLKKLGRKPLSVVEKRSAFLEHNRDTVGVIRNIHLTTNGREQISPKNTVEIEALCRVLRSPFKHLELLDIQIPGLYFNLPDQLQQALIVAFAHPTLKEVKIHGLQMPGELLTHLYRVSTLNLHCAVSALSPGANSGMCCTPEELSFTDVNFATLPNIFNENSALKLSKLKKLEAYMGGDKLHLLEAPFALCSTTLTSLTLYIDTYFCYPANFSLSSLTLLSSLTITLDLGTIFDPTNIMAAQKFEWLVNALSTCASPNVLEDITIIIRIRAFPIVAHLAWQDLDALFQPQKWPMLKKLTVRFGSEQTQAFTKADVEGEVIPRMPILRRAGVARCEVSFEILEFWRIESYT